MSTPKNYTVTEYQQATINNYPVANPVKTLTFRTEKEAVAYYQCYKNQKVMSVHEIFLFETGDMFNTIYSNI